MKNKIIVASHDAGGSEIVSSYVKANLKKADFVCFALSPISEKIYAKGNLKFKVLPVKLTAKDFANILQQNLPVKLVLTGTSWGSANEILLVNTAKKIGLKTASYIDHWTNYRERFGYPLANWQKNLPDQIWLGDADGFKMAKKLFKGVEIKLVANQYFKEIIKESNPVKGQWPQRGFTGKNILFFSEPLTSPANAFKLKTKTTFTEFTVAEQLLNYFAEQKVKSKIIIMRHPSEKPDKYNKLIAKFKNRLNVAKQTGNLMQEIAQAKLTIGMQTMALVIASLAGKPAISFIPDKKVKCLLPSNKIIKINKVEQLKKYL